MVTKVRSRGFTLIELLVVIAIIAILAAILFPVFARAREKARQTTCTSNQRQIVASVQMYAQDHEEMFPQSSTFWQDVKVDPGVLRCPSADKSIPVNYCFMSGLANTSIGSVSDPTSACVTVDAQSLVYPNILVQPSEVQMRHSNLAIAAYADGHVGVVKDQYALFPIPVIGELRSINNYGTTTLIYNPTNPLTKVAAANLNTITASCSVTTVVPTPAIGTYGVALLGTGANGFPILDENTVQAPFKPISFTTQGWKQDFKLVTGSNSRFILNNGTTNILGQAVTTSIQTSTFEKLKLSTSDYQPYIATIILSKYDGNGGSVQIGFSSNPSCVGTTDMITRGNGCKFGEAGSESLYYAYAYIYQITSPGCPVYVYLRNAPGDPNINRMWGINGIFYDKI